jgi:UDP-N-acetylmuramoyl-tripeptide--D-alanyl-D-alanine ligase
MTLIILTLLTFAFAGWRVGRRLRHFLHIFQLEGYKPSEYRSWVLDRFDRVGFRLSHKLALVELVLVSAGALLVSAYWTSVIALPLWAATFASSRLYRSERPKKPLKHTNRMKRLTAVAAFLVTVPVLSGFVLWATAGLEYIFAFLFGFFLADLMCPFWVLAAAYLLIPVEKSIQEGFKRRARRTLALRRDLRVIGITGSYGKTSTKFIIAEILRQRFSVLATPSSYNTPMGICIVVNNMLKPEHQVLILEMGIRHPGDMRELCDIARPDLAVVTSVGVAHLETMLSMENIAREKGEILARMKPGGAAVLNVDDDLVSTMAGRAQGKVWRVSVRGAGDVTARDVQYGSDGATFIVRDDTGQERAFKTRLLGEHNIVNVLLGVAVGRAMGLRLRQIAYAVERLLPIEHRLQLRKEGAITVIDDAFNSNPVGARNAVEILGQFNGGRRIIVTPGMVELGERQWEENRRLGEYIARNVDLALLVGDKQTQPIQEGLASSGYPENQIKVMPSLFAAQDFLKSYLQPGDVILYENDLPDQYSE